MADLRIVAQAVLLDSTDPMTEAVDPVGTSAEKKRAEGIVEWVISKVMTICVYEQAIVYGMCFANCGAITPDTLLLDIGSDIHLSPSVDTGGLITSLLLTRPTK